MAGFPTLIIMVKAPRIGAVKTRLAREVGIAEAWRAYRTASTNLARRLAADARWRTMLAVTPDEALDAAFWPRGLARIAQGPGDLGGRMQRLLQRFAPGPTVIVGSDIPALFPAHVAAAFRALHRAGLVFGPAADGGYWLIGARGLVRARRLFEKVRWSSPHALQDTLENARGLEVALIGELEDLDDAAAYRRWRGRLGRLHVSFDRGRAERETPRRR
jgi:hypothetical protein